MNGKREYKGAQGVTRISEPSPGVIFLTTIGFASSDLYPGPSADLEAVARARPIHIFADGWGVSGYDTEYRKRWSAWMRSNRSRIVGVDVLFQSKLVAMGIAVINLFVGGKSLVHGHASVESFERALHGAIKGKAKAISTSK